LLQLRCEFKRGAGNVITCPSFPEVHYDDEASKEGGPHHCAIVVQNIQVLSAAGPEIRFRFKIF
jgi:hypothetical protein